MTRSVMIVLLFIANTSLGAGLQVPFSGSSTEGMTRNSTIFETDGTTDASGNLVDISGSNLLLQSEDFSTTWGVSGASALPNTTRNPLDGALTADTIRENSSVSAHHFSQSATLVAGVKYTYSLYIKAGSRVSLRLESTMAGLDAQCRYRLDTRATTLVSSTGTVTTCTITPVMEQWLRISMVWVQKSNGATTIYNYLESLAGALTSQGLGTDSVYVYGAQLAQNDHPKRMGPGLYHKTLTMAKPVFDMTPTASAPTGGVAQLTSKRGDRAQTRIYDSATPRYYSYPVNALVNTVLSSNHTVTMLKRSLLAGNGNRRPFGNNDGINGYGILNEATTYTNGGAAALVLAPVETLGTLELRQEVLNNGISTAFSQGVAGTSVDVSAYLSSTSTGTTTLGAGGVNVGFVGDIPYFRLDSEALSVGQLNNDRERLQGTGRSNPTNPLKAGFNFNGTTDYYSCTDAQCGGATGFDPPGDMSVACYFNYYDATYVGTLLGKWVTTGNQRTWRFGPLIANTAYFGVSIDGQEGGLHALEVTRAMSGAGNYFITGTFAFVGGGSANVMNVYVNSLSTATQTEANGAGPLDSTGPFRLSGAGDAGFYKGKMYYCAYYNGVVLSEANHDAMYANVLTSGDPMHESLGLTPTFYTRFNEDPSAATITVPTGQVLTKTGTPTKVYTSPTTYNGWSFTRATAAWMKLPGGGASASKPSIVKVASGVPRVPDGLLIEPTVTNIQTYSEEMNRFTLNDVANSSVGTDAAIALDGATTAESWTATNTGDARERYMYNTSAIAIANATAYTYSLFARRGTTLKWIGLDFNTNFVGRDPVSFDLLAGVVGTQGAGSVGRIEPYGDDWWRISVTATSTAAASSTDVIRIYMQDGDNDRTLAGSGGIEYYVWGGQLEAKGYITSYIQTVAGTVTRNGDAFYQPLHMAGTNADILPYRLHPTDKSKLTFQYEEKCTHTTGARGGLHRMFSISGNTGTASNTRNIIPFYSDSSYLWFPIYGDNGVVSGSPGSVPFTQDFSVWNKFKLFMDFEDATRTYFKANNTKYTTTTIAPNFIDTTNLNLQLGGMITAAQPSGSCTYRNIRLEAKEF